MKSLITLFFLSFCFMPAHADPLVEELQKARKLNLAREEIRGGSLYKDYIVNKCSVLDWDKESQGVVEIFQSTAGVVEIIVGVALMTSPAGLIGLIPIGDGLGRLGAQECAGFIALDDLVLLPGLSGAQGIKAIYDSVTSKKQSGTPNSQSERSPGAESSDAR